MASLHKRQEMEQHLKLLLARARKRRGKVYLSPEALFIPCLQPLINLHASQGRLTVFPSFNTTFLMAKNQIYKRFEDRFSKNKACRHQAWLTKQVCALNQPPILTTFCSVKCRNFSPFSSLLESCYNHVDDFNI